MLDNKQKITGIIDFLITRKTEVKVFFRGEKTEFSTKVIKFDHGDVGSRIGRQPQLIVEKLSPDKGNKFIQSAPDLRLEFSVNQTPCRSIVTYLGISSAYPYFGFIVSCPETVEIQEKRREERVTYDAPEFVSVEFALGDKVYALNVIDSSRHGLGMLLTGKNLDLLERLQPGDLIENMVFFSREAMIRVNGTVRHKTRVDAGRYKGCYVVGIESPDIIENSQFNGG